ncbi:MAG: right-handed parallel beta-helix repeat-containing protein [Sphingomonadaceae bacterium]|nr:right-handed parallel beta-helix repeat-containing protein [Sphingomonadaceae bacterium]
MRLTHAAALLAIAAAPVAARDLSATPATLAGAFDRAAGGDRIVLAPGSYDPLTLRHRRWSPAVTVEAGPATLRSVRLEDVSGLTWHGGSFDGGDAERFGIGVDVADHLTIDGVTLRHFTRVGIGLGSVSDARIVNNTITDSGSDGIDVALSRRIVLDHNRCADFHPTPGAHPDCIQMWSRPTVPPTADITISNNEAIGDMQGFTMFNHARPDKTGRTVDDGGFDRVTIDNNTAKVTTWWGVGAYDCRACIVRHNRVETLPGAADPRIRAWIKLVRGDATTCDNRARDSTVPTEREPCRDGRDRDD